ncbi:TPA: hypothetical protein N0F65_007556 [Lagenidium giganteum]|uniref:RNase H type-1 domain-containing protein n=1 Tax=Lagenidium giganteum TaxID=4803 RepID=A0AAV2ZJ70_9STRA|nr:TPA: hypothetical protein N0F65_007556 [Lagenidium giganteum]
MRPTGGCKAVCHVYIDSAILSDIEDQYCYFGLDVTNNQMEAEALHQGLQALLDLGLTEAHVVGDSLMILSQYDQFRLPKHKQLERMYWTTRKLISRLLDAPLQSLHKMADAAVKHALDGKYNSAGPPTDQHTDITQHLANDVDALVISAAQLSLE